MQKCADALESIKTRDFRFDLPYFMKPSQEEKVCTIHVSTCDECQE